MASYGWTLGEAFDLTLPQMLELLGAMKRWPPINLATPMILRGISGGDKNSEEDMIRNLKKIGGVKMTDSGEASKFFAALAGGGVDG